MASPWENCSLITARMSSRAEPNSRGKSTLVKSYSRIKPLLKTAATPTMRKILAIFDPKTLPKTISEELSKTATREERSSGREVPTDNNNTPTIKEGNRKNKPKTSAESVKKSEDLINAAKLTIKTRDHSKITDVIERIVQQKKRGILRIGVNDDPIRLMIGTNFNNISIIL